MNVSSGLSRRLADAGSAKSTPRPARRGAFQDDDQDDDIACRFSLATRAHTSARADFRIADRAAIRAIFKRT
jgi:hypothetical protein